MMERGRFCIGFSKAEIQKPNKGGGTKRLNFSAQFVPTKAQGGGGWLPVAKRGGAAEAGAAAAAAAESMQVRRRRRRRGRRERGRGRGQKEEERIRKNS